MNRQKRRIFKFLLLIYFLIYVVSPLCYTGDQLYEDCIIIHETKNNTKNIVFIWGLIISKIFQQEDSADDPSDNVRLLLKKKRAVLWSNNTTKIKQSESAVSTPNEFISPIEPLRTLVELTNSTPQNSSHPSFSGLSPPIVYSFIR